MRLKSICLANIRSYEAATIEFPLGTTLFEGDIRSGKSTILYGIEFALFGLGSLRGAYLLRNEAKEGSVTLVFDIDGQEYEVYRGLKRRRDSVNQSDEGYIKGPNGKSYLAAGELKDKVLQILNFNEPTNPKAQSVIYRYAVFTPQDEMKDVITKDVDKRLQTLRRAYRIEDYKIASTNASYLTSVIKEKSAWLAGQAEDLADKRMELEDAVKMFEESSKRLEPLQEKEKSQASQLEKNQEMLRKLGEEKGKIEQLGMQLPEIEGQIKEKIRERDKTNGDIERFNNKILKELQPVIAELKKAERPTPMTYEQLNQERLNHITQIKDSVKLKGQLEEREGNFDLLIKEKSCPVCNRDLEPEEFVNKLSHVKLEKEMCVKTINEWEKESRNIDALIEKLKNFERDQERLRQLEPQLKEAKERVEEINEGIPKISKAIGDLQSKLEKSRAEAAGLDELLRKIGILDKESRELNEKLQRTRNDIAGLRKDIESSDKSITKLKDDIAKKKAHALFKESLDEHKIWLGEYFIPTLENIEKHVMITINQRFNDQFQKWFQILIEDPEMQVRVDEEFTPIIEQNGYEQDYFSLSGGEKTSIALAYRLALNTTVQEVSTGMKSNLLILDEPTDGFSKEQVFKIRDILNELNCPQVLIVSHERELESCADQVFRIHREHGVSSVNRVK